MGGRGGAARMQPAHTRPLTVPPDGQARAAACTHCQWLRSLTRRKGCTYCGTVYRVALGVPRVPQAADLRPVRVPGRHILNASLPACHLSVLRRKTNGVQQFRSRRPRRREALRRQSLALHRSLGRPDHVSVGVATTAIRNRSTRSCSRSSSSASRAQTRPTH
jgi:hypothetical protein